VSTLARTLVALVALVWFGTAAGSGTAQPRPTLLFVGEAFATTCADLANGVDVVVTNATSKEQAVKVVLNPATPAEKRLANACGGLSLDQPAAAPAGEDIVVRLTADSAEGPAVAIEGAMTVFAESGAVSRLPIEIAADTDTGAAVPLVTSVSGTQYLGNGDEDTPFYVPIDLGEATAPNLSEGDVVGGVSGDADRGAVTYVDVKVIDGISMVALDANGLRAGEYTGGADLVPDDEDEGEVSLALTVKDAWGWAAVALALGFLASFLAQRSSGYWVPRHKLKGKVGAVAGTYRTARAGLAGVSGAGKWKESAITDIEPAIAAMKGDVDARFKGAYLSVEQKVIDGIEALDRRATCRRNRAY